MFCRNCGKQINDEIKYCPFCGTATNFTPAQTQHGSNSSAPAKKTNPFSIAGFVLSLVSFYLGFFFCIIPALGLVFGIIGLNAPKETNSGHGLALAGVIISSITFAFWCIYWIFIIFAATTIPF